MGWQGLSLMRLRSGKVPRVLGSVLGKERKEGPETSKGFD